MRERPERSYEAESGQLRSVDRRRSRTFEGPLHAAKRRSVHDFVRRFVPLLKSAGEGTVVMVSSGLGSLGWLSDPANQFYGVSILGYNSSKSALNAVALAFAKELASVGIKVDAVDPGYTATDFNNHSGHLTVEQAAAGIVWLATQDPAGPSGRFYFEQNQIPW